MAEVNNISNEPPVFDAEKPPSVSDTTEAGSHQEEDGSHDDELASLPPNSPGQRIKYFFLLLLLAVIALVVVLPLVLVDRGSSSSKSASALQYGSDSDSNSGGTLDDSQEQSSASFTNSQHDGDEDDDDDGQCLGNLEEEEGHWGQYNEISSLFFQDMSLGVSYDRTFDVVDSYQVLTDQPGVLFNVETVPDALDEHLNKPHLDDPDKVLAYVQAEAGEFYRNTSVYNSPTPEVVVEVASVTPDNLIFAGGQGFLVACMMSFAQHLPLALNAEHLWTVITNGFARHVDQYPEELRHNFVDHDGKKDIVIREDRMVLGQSSPEQWEDLIFPKFSAKISENLNNQQVYETLSDRFSTTTDTTQATAEIVLMSAMKNYFDYTMVTACGIPQIRLEGTRDDWVALRDRTESLAQWMMQNHTHGDLWIKDIVLPILDEFLNAYDGDVNHCFWQNMVKFRVTAPGSGSYSFLSGWLHTLFPYLEMGNGKSTPNQNLRHWRESASAQHKGPEPRHIPSQLSSAFVKWIYFGTEYPVHFHAGFRGVTQEEDGTLQPVLGWYVTHDPKDE